MSQNAGAGDGRRGAGTRSGGCPGVAADQERRVHRAGRDRRRRRSDGADDPGHHREERADGQVARRGQQVGRRRRRSVPRREGRRAIRTRSSSRSRTCSRRRSRPASRSTGRTSRRSACWRSTSSSSGSTQVALPDPGRLCRRAKGGAPNIKMGGTGSKQEDQIITAAIEQATGAKITYIPYKGGGDVAAQLVGGHVDSSVNNPVEAVAQWRAGELRPLCIFGDARADYKDRSRTARPGPTSRPARKRARHRVQHAARHLHHAGATPSRSRSMST